MGAHILILGGGSGGLVAANKLAKALRGRGHTITVVDRSPYHYFQPSFPWVALGFKEPEEVRRPLHNLEKKGVRFLQDEVEAILPEDKQVRLKENGTLAYDYLVVSLGAELGPDLMPGFHLAHHPWSVEGALKMREALTNFEGGRVVISVSGPYYRCPPAPFEVAGQLDFNFKARRIRSKTEIVVAHPNPAPLAGMGPAISGLIMEILRNKNVRFEGNFNAERIDPERKILLARDGRELPFDLLVMVPPHRPNRLVQQLGPTTPQGFPVVDPETFRSVKYPEIFMIGDMVNPSLNLPPAGVVAHFQAEFVANEIVAEVKGAYIGESFTPVAMCIMDFGDDAVLPMCDFTQILTLEGPPSCGVLGRGKAVRVAKMLFESLWFATLLN
ncbi:MAG: FAD-dependent oxidoreductase [Candidatus Hydrothermae bacterium]|nr:FAD-dependent oxidoreductase [Candidatus Hydrothermae bacterium]